MTTESHEAPGEAEDVIEITAVITSDDWTEASMRNDRGHLASRRRVALFGDLALLPIGLMVIASMNRPPPFCSTGLQATCGSLSGRRASD
ncbi:hypothetical protein [Methylobacterium indicum]|uniref:hypothetical protein n=1 Tax=Methylobacterium indicum TaxID=1775910 RepID=UPI002435B2C1|nr:hypothetical protein [Methylobacterium indicum]